jgi:hypothetical protein
VCVSLSAWNNSAPKGCITWNSMIENFSKICRENLRFVTNGYFAWRPIYCIRVIISCSVLLIMTDVSEKSYKGNQNTHFYVRNIYLENHDIYEITWENSI